MHEAVLLLAAVAVFATAAAARRMTTTPLTPPMLFLGLGLALSGAGLAGDVRDLLLPLAEVTLAIVLFADAAHVDCRKLMRDWDRPARMLVFGLPLAALFGGLAAWLLLPGLTVAEAALLGALMSPTDAALGRAVITNPRVPERLRRTVELESGLNDGLSLPLVLFIACIVLGQEAPPGGGGWVRFALEQIGFGFAVGLAAGLAGGALLKRSTDAGWTDETGQGVAALAVAGVAYAAAHALGGNGFVAAFVGGIAFGERLGPGREFAREFAEGEGRMLVLGAFLLVGVALAPQALASLDWRGLAFLLASLFVTRPLAIWLSLIGTGARPAERLFLGWFGPRGLATALFALLVVERLGVPGDHAVISLAIAGVCLSAVLHGVTAAPAARLWSR